MKNWLACDMRMCAEQEYLQKPQPLKDSTKGYGLWMGRVVGNCEAVWAHLRHWWDREHLLLEMTENSGSTVWGIDKIWVRVYIRKKGFGPKETQSNLGNFNFPKATLTL